MLRGGRAGSAPVGDVRSRELRDRTRAAHDPEQVEGAVPPEHGTRHGGYSTQSLENEETAFHQRGHHRDELAGLHPVRQLQHDAPLGDGAGAVAAGDQRRDRRVDAVRPAQPVHLAQPLLADGPALGAGVRDLVEDHARRAARAGGEQVAGPSGQRRIRPPPSRAPLHGSAALAG